MSGPNLYKNPPVLQYSKQGDKMSVREGKTVIVGTAAVGATLLYNLRLKAEQGLVVGPAEPGR